MAQEQRLRGKTIAILLTDGFEQVEMTTPRQAFEDAGAKTLLVSPNAGQVQGWHHYEHADSFDVDVPLDDADVSKFDALMLPGGVANPDQLRAIPKAVEFVRGFARAGKPIAAICHGPWTLIEADLVRGRKVTSWPSLKTDLRNAGASWVDEEVVVDRGLVTSRKPDDIPAFDARVIEEFARSHAGPQAQARRQPSA